MLGAGRLGRALLVALLLGGGLLLMRATAPPVPSIAASPDAPAPRTVERAEGLVLRVEPGATSVLPEGELGNVPGGGRGTVLTLRVTSGSQQGREVQVTLPAGQLATSAASAAGYRRATGWC